MIIFQETKDDDLQGDENLRDNLKCHRIGNLRWHFSERRISSAVEIREVNKDKKQYLALLMSADEQEDMIDRYIERGRMFVLWDDGAKGECVITDEGNGVLENKDISPF